MWKFKWITNLIKSLLHEKTKAFLGGAFGTFPLWIGFFFNNISLNEHAILSYIAKGVGTVALTFISGLASALAKDAWDYWKANRKLKRQRKNQKLKDHGEQKQIWGKNGQGDHRDTA